MLETAPRGSLGYTITVALYLGSWIARSKAGHLGGSAAPGQEESAQDAANRQDGLELVTDRSAV